MTMKPRITSRSCKDCTSVNPPSGRPYQVTAVLTFLLFFLGSLCTSALAQDRLLNMPKKYYKPNPDIDLGVVNASDRLSLHPWMVLVVSDNVRTTTQPGGGHFMKTLAFLDHFFVSEESGDYLRITRTPARNVLDPGPGAEDYGWVHKNDLLMWGEALSNPNTRIHYKAIILNTQRALGSPVEEFSVVRSYKEEGLENPTDYQANLFEIFYIYRYSADKQSVLLGYSHNFSERTENKLIGWVDRNRVLEWDHRVAVEPNWEARAVQERMNKEIKAKVFPTAMGSDSRACATAYLDALKIKEDCEPIWDHDIYDSEDDSFKRKNGYWRRFPVIGDYTEGDQVYQMMVMGELSGELGRIDPEQDASLRRRLNELIQKSNTVNLMFAIDGTASMEPYYTSVVHAVDHIVEMFRDRYNGMDHELRLGYVVYRDEAQIEANMLTTQRGLTPSVRADVIVDELRKMYVGDKLWDPFHEEAVNYGLREALQEFRHREDETNILIHIGDARSHQRSADYSFVEDEKVISLLADRNVFYIAYQAHYTNSHSAYSDFGPQVKRFMRDASQRIFHNQQERLGVEFVSSEPYLSTRGNVTRVEDGMPMVFLAVDYGETYDLVELEREIITAFIEIDEYRNTVNEYMRDMLERGRGYQVTSVPTDNRYTSSYAAGVYNFLLRTGITSDQLEKYYRENVQMVMSGYAGLGHPDLNKNVFRPVLLLRADEFHEMITKVEDLNAATSIGDRRTKLQEVWRQLLRTHVGGQEEDYDELSLEEASSMVFGIPVRSQTLETIQLKDITDDAVFTNMRLEMYLKLVRNRLSKLQSIRDSADWEYSFLSNETRYYWIDIELLP